MFRKNIVKGCKMFLVFAVIFINALVAYADVEVGQSAPAFSVVGVDGKNHTLDEFKGKYLVLEWTNPGCPFVKKHYSASNMQSLQKKYIAKGIAWVTVDSSAEGKQGYMTAEQAKEWINEQGAFPTAFLLDAEGKVGQAYGAKTTPHMFVINPEGKVIYAGAIDDNDSVKSEIIPSSKNYVAQALDEALAGKPVTVAATDSYGCGVKYRS